MMLSISIRKIFFILLIVIGIPSCIPAVFMAGAAAAGVVIYDQRSPKIMFDDKNIIFTVQNALNNDSELRNKSHVTIIVFNHIALLVGQTPTVELRNRAETLVKANTKIKILYNELTVEQPISDVARAGDTWLTTKVKTSLLAAPGLNSASLKVITENGVVYLLGLTTRTQAQIATAKTRTVAGVKKVVKLFEYIN